MIPFNELKERLQQSSVIENPLKHRLWILAVLTEALKTIGERPVLIGGEALEYHIFSARPGNMQRKKPLQR